MTCKSKKQTVVARSSAEAEYRAMAHTACELQTLLSELGVEVSHPMRMFYDSDNQAATHIASNLVFHERRKHFEVALGHFVREKRAMKEFFNI